MKLIVLGPQGSGKGTQAQRLAEHFSIVHIDVGQLIRDESLKPTGIKIRKIIDEGKLLPNAIPNKIVKARLAEPDVQDGWILDGYPRNLAEAEFLDEIDQPDAVIFLEISDKIAVERLGQRRICSKCHKIYDASAKKCGCGGKLIQREDDTPKAIKKRLELYHDETEPLHEYYKPRKISHVIDGTKAPDNVFKDILKVL